MTGSQAPPDPQPWPLFESDRHGWPDIGDCSAPDGAYSKDLCAAKLELRKKRTDQEIARAKAEADVDLAVEQEYYKAVIEVAKGSIERVRASAQTVQSAAAAVGTIYTGVLALAFSAADAPLPSRALFAAVFLALAMALSTAYLAYLPDPPRETDEPPDGGPPRPARDGAGGSDGESQAAPVEPPQRLTNLFVEWTKGAALQRAPWLRASVVALAVAVVLLPAPFVTLEGDDSGSADAAEVASSSDWPKPEDVPDGSVELQRILYRAQVEEVAAARKQPVAAETSDEWWWVISIVGAFAIVVAGARRVREADA